jgi:hypothetical protein
MQEATAAVVSTVPAAAPTPTSLKQPAKQSKTVVASGGAVEDAAAASSGAVVATKKRKLDLPRAQNKAPVWVVGQSVRSKETPQKHGTIMRIVSIQALLVSWSDTPTVTSYVKKNAVK